MTNGAIPLHPDDLDTSVLATRDGVTAAALAAAKDAPDGDLRIASELHFRGTTMPNGPLRDLTLEAARRLRVAARLVAGVRSVMVGDVHAYERNDVEEGDGSTWELRADGDVRWVPREEAMGRLRREVDQPRAPQVSPEIQAVTRRAALGGRWRDPDGVEKTASRVEQIGDPVYLCGRLVGVEARDLDIVWTDGTKTPAKIVAHPRLGWEAILEAEERA
jgi:hypothetical protein